MKRDDSLEIIDLIVYYSKEGVFVKSMNTNCKLKRNEFWNINTTSRSENYVFLLRESFIFTWATHGKSSTRPFWVIGLGCFLSELWCFTSNLYQSLSNYAGDFPLLNKIQFLFYHMNINGDTPLIDCFILFFFSLRFLITF